MCHVNGSPYEVCSKKILPQKSLVKRKHKSIYMPQGSATTNSHKNQAIYVNRTARQTNRRIELQTSLCKFQITTNLNTYHCYQNEIILDATQSFPFDTSTCIYNALDLSSWEGTSNRNILSTINSNMV